MIGLNVHGPRFGAIIVELENRQNSKTVPKVNTISVRNTKEFKPDEFVIYNHSDGVVNRHTGVALARTATELANSHTNTNNEDKTALLKKTILEAVKSINLPFQQNFSIKEFLVIDGENLKSYYSKMFNEFYMYRNH